MFGRESMVSHLMPSERNKLLGDWRLFTIRLRFANGIDAGGSLVKVVERDQIGFETIELFEASIRQ